ncbi:MAG TPA: DHA2 family efflux MFS transporter permease subunit [Allosphingosinicella sp.]|nr:DHA2 family efflux MFS transporter permease subunit [Allosphingosinicella sp.]
MAQWTDARSAAGRHNPWLIVCIVSLATFMEVLDTSIANVSLRHIAGGLSASYDEATWVLTSYLISNAIIIPISGWLSDVIGRKRYYMISVALFTGSSLLCGLSPSLSVLIFARILQGIGGGGLAPSEQSILADTFSPAQRGKAFAAYGIVVVVGPILGPTLGGTITDHASWHWIFLINVPVGILSLILVGTFLCEPEALVKERQEKLKDGLRVDALGFALVALGLGFLEFTLDRGERDDWFSSPTILATTAVSAVALIALVFRELMARDPIVNLRLLGNRNFAITVFVMATVGLIVFGSTQIIPQMLQQVMDYSATEAGLALTAGGLATIVVMPVVGMLAGRVDTRFLIVPALAVTILALFHLASFNTDISFRDAAFARLFQAVALPFLFVPVNTAAYVGLRPEETNQASALLNVSRNLGGSFGIAWAQTLLVRREQFHQARLVEGLNPLNPNFAQALHGAQSLITSGVDQMTGAMGVIYQQVQQQATTLAFLDVFHAFAIFVLFVAPSALFLKGGKPAEAAH